MCGSTSGFRILASDGFIREVDEELQRDRMAQLWKRFGPLVVGAAVVVVAAVAGKVGWDAWQARILAEQSAAFASAEAARGDGNLAAAAERYAGIAESAGADVAALARLHQAEAALAAGDANNGMALLDQVTKTGAVDPILRDFAAIALALKHLDDGDTSAVSTVLEDHDASIGAFSHTARELAAVAAIRRGDTAAGIEALQALLTDVGTPDGTRRRASELLAALGVVDEAPLSPTDHEAEEAS